MRPQYFLSDDDNNDPIRAKIKKYWDDQKRKGIGNTKNLKSPEQLWELACEYFNKVDSLPWIEKKYMGKDVVEVEIKKTVAYSWAGLQVHLYDKGIKASLKDYRQNNGDKYAEYSHVLKRIGDVIKQRIIEGISMGYFNDVLLKHHDVGFRVREETDEKRQVFIINGQEIVVGK